MEESISEGVAFSLMVALGETYFPAFVLAAGLGEVSSGLVVTLPLLVGATLQLFSHRFLLWVGSYRKWVVLFTSLQGLSLAPLIWFAMHGTLTLEAMFLCAMFYSSSGLLAGPCWNSWITSIVPERLHTRFFARRNRGLQMASLVGFLIGGVALRYLPQGHTATSVFVPLFAGALLARFFSVLLLTKLPEPRSPRQECFPNDISAGQLFTEIKNKTQYGKIVFYLFAFQFAVHTASPFVNPYLLHKVGFSYFEYALLITATYLTKILFLPMVGVGIRKQGCEKYMRFGGIMIALIPALLMVSNNFYWILSVQLLSGLFWASFDLSSLMILLSSLPQKNRTAFLAYFHFGNAIALATSSLIGGFLLRHSGPQAYFVIFGLSTVLRASTILLLKSFAHKKAKTHALEVEPLQKQAA